MEKYDLIVIGAGASGMMAALQATSRGKKVLLLEKQPQAGMKLRITGKGRCNLGNVCSVDEFLQHCGSDPNFLYPALQLFFHSELIAFFEKEGVPLVVERGKRIFPQSGKALDVFKALINRIERSEIELLKSVTVASLSCKGKKLLGVSLVDGREISSSKVILAAGGQSYPLTGSTGDGVRLAEEVGHTIVPCFPALVGLKPEEKIPQSLLGFPLRNVRVRCFNKTTGEKIDEVFGEMTFGRACLEGPIILSLSRRIAPRIGKEPISIAIDFKPALSEGKIAQKIEKVAKEREDEPLKSILRAWVPRQLVELFVQRIPRSLASKRGRDLTTSDRSLILQLLKRMEFNIIGTEGWNRAVVTQGGVSLDEINPETLSSKIIEGLYFAGEVMDLDADTGGYNLQIAFSTGFLAGKTV